MNRTYNFEKTKDQLNGWNPKFWDELEGIFDRILFGEATIEEMAVVSAGSFVECFGGTWSFQLPTTRECYDWVRSGAEPSMTIQAWSEDGNGPVEVYNFEYPKWDSDTAVTRLIREIKCLNW